MYMVVFGHGFVIGLTALDKGGILVTMQFSKIFKNLFLRGKTRLGGAAAQQIAEIARLGQRLVVMELS